MKNILYFDLETQKSAEEVGGWNHISRMGMSVGVTFSTATGDYRIYSEKHVDELIKDLQRALADVKTLSGLLPICAGCKKIRDDRGYWQQVEEYISNRSEARFTHGYCPDCIRRLYPEIAQDILRDMSENRPDETA